MSDLDKPRHPSRPIWAVAAIGAVAIHAGGFALALNSMQPDSETALGASAIEIGVELEAPHVDPSDLPVGPDTPATAASPAVVEQKSVAKQSDLPKAVPTETDDPDRVVTQNAAKDPQDDPKVPAVAAAPSAQSVASEETATQSVKGAVELPRSVAPALGTGESTQRDRVTWQKELAAHFNKFKRYPVDRALQRAEVIVSFVLDRLGHVVSVRLVKGSGDASFDAAAVEMLNRADPVPPPPPLVADEGLTFTLPVIFHAKGAAASDHSPR